MPRSKPVIKQIEEDMLDAIGTPTVRIDSNNPIAIVQAPVDVGLTSLPKNFIPVSNLTDLNDLPFIPERKRDFAFRYATEYRPNTVWAKEYGVARHTIWKWLQEDGVQAYIARTRYESRFYNFAQRMIINRQLYRTINNVISMPLNEDTAGVISDMCKFLYKALNDPTSVADKAKASLNVSVGVHNQMPSSGNPYKIEEAPVEVTLRDLDEVEAELQQLRRLADDYGIEL